MICSKHGDDFLKLAVQWIKDLVLPISEVIGCIITLCAASTAQSKMFTQYQHNSKLVMAQQSSTLQASSVLDCALLCTQILSYCHSFIYNKTTGECTAGTWICPAENPTILPLGDWYVQPGFVCDGSNGFSCKQWYQNPYTCLWLSDFEANNTDAKKYCQDLGGLLYVKDPPYKEFLLTYSVLNSFDNESFWLANGYTDAGTSCNFLSMSSRGSGWNYCTNQQRNNLFRFVCELN